MHIMISEDCVSKYDIKKDLWEDKWYVKQHSIYFFFKLVRIVFFICWQNAEWLRSFFLAKMVLLEFKIQSFYILYCQVINKDFVVS